MKHVLRYWITGFALIFFFAIGTATSPPDDWAVLALNVGIWEDGEQLLIINQDTFDYIDADYEIVFTENDICRLAPILFRGDTLVINYDDAIENCLDSLPTTPDLSIQSLSIILRTTPEPSLEGHFYKEF